MWQVYAFRAADLVRERQQEAARDRLERESRAPTHGSRRRTPGAAPGIARRLAAGGLNLVAAAAVSVSRRAGTAAARLEGRAV